MKKRKNYTKDFKARVALDAIKGQKTINKLATEYGVHSNQIGQWKNKLIAESTEFFSQNRGQDTKANEAEKDRLYHQIGKLQVEMDWLKKQSATEHEPD